jgi:hypothetical protein
MSIALSSFFMDDKTFKEVETHLQNLLRGMNLPSYRINKKDWRWFSRNMHINSRDHMLFDEAAIMLRKVLEHQSINK